MGDLLLELDAFIDSEKNDTGLSIQPLHGSANYSWMLMPTKRC